jgi:hypothetical protein
MSNQNTYTNAHALLLAVWANPEMEKLLGPKPTEAQLAAAVQLGNRPGRQTLALAMAMRDVGTTGPQIQLACGAPQNNKRADMIKAALLKRVMTAPDATGHTVYKVELTAKGKARCELNAKLEAALEAEGDKPEAALEAEGEGEGDKPEAAKADKPAAKGTARAKGAAKGKKATKVAAAETPTSEPATAIEQASIEVPAVEPVTETAQAAE